MSQSKPQTMRESVEDCATTLEGLAEICEKYGDYALNIVNVFTQLKAQSRVQAQQLRAQLKQDDNGKALQPPKQQTQVSKAQQ